VDKFKLTPSFDVFVIIALGFDFASRISIKHFLARRSKEVVIARLADTVMPQSIDHRVKYTSMRTVSLTDQPDPDTLTERSVSPNRTTLTSEPTPKEDHSPAVWGLGWRSPTLMVVLYLCGLALSVGHHLYYNSLDNTLVKSAEQQTWAIRIGTGFAFVVKTLLVAAIGIAAVQQIWATLRRKSVNLRGIDAMFSVLSDPLTFFVPDMWMCAKTLTLLAIVSW
jgi:hypothetical protein